jgi:hypothetical protein
MYALLRSSPWKEFRQLLQTRQRSFFIQLQGLEVFVEIAIEGNRDSPKVKGVGGNMIEVGALLLLDRILEHGDGFLLRNFDFKNTIRMIATEVAIDGEQGLRKVRYND